ncbi:MAG: rhodanese-like domain-containing protein [Cyclobacteriaceae bacterium]
MKNITGQELRDIAAKDQNAVIIDVRTAEEIQSGIIKGAMHIDVMGPEFAQKINELSKDKTYLMVCRSGNRSGSACGFMMQNGFTNVYNLSGGMMAWDGETI